MKLFDYFVGQSVVLISRLPLADVEQRINDATPPWYWPFADGVRGWAWFGRVRLSYTVAWFFDYGAKPVLAGRLVDELGATRLQAKYRAPASAYIFYAMWYFVLTSTVISLLASWFDDKLEPGGWTLLPFIGIMLAAPLVMHFVFTRKSEDDLDAVLVFLANEAEFVADINHLDR
ncbi:hypothetical protein GRI41_10310 [Altererythrobacter aquaemixtae]|uniref:Uncharacterized protein n=2 Tax=Pontixanthobacter aquaemixtae TaxID=1958940 RepID=A0A844ZWT2_9SPHN|nr:hypothetical protein [Pontixanthobacter aquaemixtae]